MKTELNANPKNPKNGESTEYDGTKTRYSSRESVKVVLVDLDGCISDDSARRAKLPFGAYGAPMLPGQSGGAEDCKLKSADFDAYCENEFDDPAVHIGYLCDLARRGAEIVICTARSAKRANDTFAWLNKHHIPYSAIAMRRDDDTTPAPVLKVAWARYLSQPSTQPCPGELRYEVSHSRFWRGMRGERYTLEVLGGIDDRLDVLAAYEAAGFKSARLEAKMADETVGALQLMWEHFPCVLDGSRAVPRMAAWNDLARIGLEPPTIVEGHEPPRGVLSVAGDVAPQNKAEAFAAEEYLAMNAINVTDMGAPLAGSPPPRDFLQKPVVVAFGEIASAVADLQNNFSARVKREIEAQARGVPRQAGALGEALDDAQAAALKPRADSDRVPEILRAAAATFEERNPAYGSSYKKFGAVLMALYPDGVTLSTPEEFERFGLLVMAVGKVQRYCASPNGHADSAHDLINYAAMLEELTP